MILKIRRKVFKTLTEWLDIRLYCSNSTSMLWKIKAAFGTGIMCKDGLPLEVKFKHLSIHIESEKSHTKAKLFFLL